MYVVAVDSGGTFTDCVAIDERGRIVTAKAPSTPDDYSRGMLDAVATVARSLATTVDALLASTVLFAHGTTVATNALLTRSGSRTGLVTTVGHEDFLLIGRTQQKIAGLGEDAIRDVSHLDKPVPLVSRRRIVGVHERVDSHGDVIAPLDPASVESAVDTLLEAGCDSVAVCLLWSFLRPDHERAVRDAFHRRLSELPVSLSSDLAPVIKEYERGATTVVNAYLYRSTADYLQALAGRLRTQGLPSDPLVMQSSGGVTSLSEARERPVHLLTSGPAGGVVGAAVLAERMGLANVITTDVGGTSFDVGLVVDGEPRYADAPVFDQYHLSLPVIDVATIGAGGGSVAWIEPGTGALRVGPQSAGAAPGPACYGNGGQLPTVTDANVVLGRIDPETFLGGRRRLDASAAVHAIEQYVAAPLGKGLAEAAMGIVAIADAHMADLVRKVTLERGFDPRHFGLFAFGGAGPLHVGAYGKDVECPLAIVPETASVFSAFGIAGSDPMVVEEFADPMFAPLDPDRVARAFRRLEKRCRERLLGSGVPEDTIHFRRYMRLRYRGQVHEIRTPVPLGDVDEMYCGACLAAFERLYESRYGIGTAYKRAGVQVLTFHVHGLGRFVAPRLEPEPSSADVPREWGNRRVYFQEAGAFVDTPVFRREDVAPGGTLRGPALVESSDTTLVLHPGQEAEMDGFHNLRIRLA